MMLGVQFQEVCDALAEAFDDLDELDRMLKFRLSIKRQNIVAGGALDTVVFKLLQKAEAQGWEIDLILAAFRHVPRNRKLATVYQTYGLASDATVQVGGASSGGVVKATDGGFEKRITDLAMIDLGVWREKLSKIENTVS